MDNTEPSGETPDGSSVSNDAETAGLESDLLGNDAPPVDDGTGAAPDAAPVDDGTGTMPDDGTGAAPEVEDEDPVKAIQKLTGKLSQKMRDTEEKLTPEDLKYILNSIISAADVKKLNDEDRTDITNKIEDKEEEGGEEINEFGMPEIWGNAPQSAFYTASGGQTIGENTKKRLESILEQARQNVKNKLNK
jgi:hypothetical protein